MRLLVLNFFPAFFPPASGGELRYFHLYSRLSKHFDVTLLSPTYSDHKAELIAHSPSFREHRVPKEAVHHQIHQSIATAKIAEEFSALVCALTSRHPNEYHRAYLELQKNADCIVHESPYMLEYDMLFGIDERPRIYNSYNVESDLVSQLWKGAHAKKYLEFIEELEGKLVRGSQICFAVSTSDAARFATKFHIASDRFAIAENGIDPEEFDERQPRKNVRPTALFFGSLHPPNIEAANFVITALARVCPSIDFVVAGSCMPANRPDLPDNVKTLGRVDDATRKKLFATSDVALNPMFSGSGTNLKTLEYLAARIPMISTDLGARGISLIHGQSAVISDADHFAADLRNFLDNPERMQRIADQGFAHVTNLFSWDSIAERTANTLREGIRNKRKSFRKSLLLLNDFSASKPTAGGEIRINRIYRHLAQTLRITLICFTNESTIRRVQIAEDFIEIQIPKTAKHLEEEAHYHHWKTSVADIVSYKQAPKNELLQNLVSNLSATVDLIVLCHPYMASLVAKGCIKPIIYESLNVEFLLKRNLLTEHPARGELIKIAEECETTAVELCSEIITVSEDDQQLFRRHFSPRKVISVVPNGADVPATASRGQLPESITNELRGRSFIVFVGSAHPPNVEAATYITSQLAPRCEDFVFGIVGNVCQAISTPIPKNVIAFGMLDEEEKRIVFELADIAINPMREGSGSNLKIADYFSQALPTITTAFGARGYAIFNQREAIICELGEFSTQIQSLGNDKSSRDRLSRECFKFAQRELDWSRHAQKFLKVVERVTSSERKKRLLVVTHRFTDPPLGGAETYLLELIRQLDAQKVMEIELATLDIVDIKNEFHFSCSYTRHANLALPKNLSNISVNRFPVDELDAQERSAGARQIFEVWNEESRRNPTLGWKLLPDAVLLGGWYHAEPQPSGTIQRWSSPKAFFRAKDVERVFLKGFAPSAVRLEMRLGGKIQSRIIEGNFDIEFATHREELVELSSGEPYFAEGDARPLGILITEIQVQTGNVKRFMPLDTTSYSLLRQLDPAVLIDHLVGAAERRDERTEELFQRTRGPNSSALQGWLDGNAGNFDVILGHCLPFATFVTASRAADATKVPFVAIPHMHVDDEFYHWKRYFEALRKASVCLVHPRAAIDLFFRRIGANSTYLPFGINVADESCVDSDTEGFRALYHLASQYVLVLGRKTKGKQYDVVIESVSKLRSVGHDCRVVMIGGDEDGAALDPEAVSYLGRQPSDIVRAAIQGSLCLVTMSDSESFGIVILEAWSEGKPVIVNGACLAFTELVHDGEDGLHASNENLGEKIAFLLGHPEATAAMGSKGKAKLVKNFSWRSIGQHLNDALCNAMGAAPL